jgi:hypothetical protein
MPKTIAQPGRVLHRPTRQFRVVVLQEHEISLYLLTSYSPSIHLMATSCKTRVVRLGGQNTRRNLPQASARKRGESNFLRGFERAYFANDAVGGIASREFTIEGFGRADLIWLAWTHSGRRGDFSAMELKKVRLTAIEAKLADWRKGLQQAYRYRYFSDRSLLVLPRPVAIHAREFLRTFRRLRVGLWSFDPETYRIQKIFTPRCSPPLNSCAREKALVSLQRAFKPLLVAQTKRARRGLHRYVVRSSGRVKRRRLQLR